ncbi:hypothetical protein G7Y89_g3745 [Cudoniella acicularis]|uniref:Uncharacterized protein n=1 Tax=Cudoniella acicularis TaxID=354080 RepID=A0A8H4RSX6_9HELO|nr:hypothetical protein G7Y89_g3745 [Cudoniella acicularis]
MHVSHTFTHESQDAAVYSDVKKEIEWNQAWLNMMGLSSAKWFSGGGFIPPAITGMHNADALRAWMDNGLGNAVGDNTRPVLLNTQNEHWPLITSVAGNGYDGVQITPRWATNIFYNASFLPFPTSPASPPFSHSNTFPKTQCDTPTCDLAEWVSFGNVGSMSDILTLERKTNSRHLLALRHDPFMFHQANLRWEGQNKTTINGVYGQYSMLQMWVETVVTEVTRLVQWPILSLKHDDIAAAFRERATRDACGYSLSWNFSNQTITSVTVSAPSVSDICSVPIPVTIPGSGVVDDKGFKSEKLGIDPLTIWVVLNGSNVTLQLKDAVSWSRDVLK